MKLSRRGASADTTDDAVDSSQTEQPTAESGQIDLRKGRPTPKRRVAEGRRGPVTAPKTRKEAYARQKQLTKEQRATPKSGGAPAKPRSAAEQRAALRRGDADALPRRDQGKTRKLARDYVDSKRMLSNYMLWLFPLFILTTIIPALRYLEVAVIVIFLGLVVEWFIVGRRLRAMALERFGEADGTNMGIGFYMGSRAYMPRKWRLPAPQLTRGDEF
ncbi:DUF3043 domain-containing protein [uncultured Jatrophihabitans sp.]|uniref:DUF3043 domain-containing protein n=1 Tax=uncultured Jatrophihabitans sp. TaxID=1610747 RepID=UPI0035CB7CF0